MGPRGIPVYTSSLYMDLVEIFTEKTKMELVRHCIPEKLNICDKDYKTHLESSSSSISAAFWAIIRPSKSNESSKLTKKANFWSNMAMWAIFRLVRFGQNFV